MEKKTEEKEYNNKTVIWLALECPTKAL